MWGVNGHIRGVEIEVCQGNLVKMLWLKQSLKHFAPLEMK